MSAMIQSIIPSVVKNVLAFGVLLFLALRLTAQTISSFSPTSGPVGTSVSISGSGFNTTASDNIVFLGATMANVTSASATSLTVTAPSGTNFQYITVTNLTTNLTAYSAKPFIATNSCSSASSFSLVSGVQGGSHNVEIYDMDGDGKPDLIIPDYFNNQLTVTRNTSTAGSLSFAPKVTFPWAAGGQPNEVSIGDFDGDGKPDVALGGNGGGTFVSVYRNTSTPGNISFATRQDFTASTGQGNGNKIIDIDGDGKPDLLSVHWSGNCLWVLRNTSTGSGNISFAAGVSFGTTSQPHKIDVGDLDGDGKPDVVITAFTSNTMSIFRNTSSPGTISFAARQDFAPGLVPYFVHIGDLDGDGKADIAVVNRDVATLAVYRNTSTPGTISLATKQDFATPTGTFTHYGVAIGDLDGDGKPDVVAGNYTLNVTSVFRNTSTPGAISFATRVDLASGVSYDVGICDFDGDNRPDIAVTNSGTTVSILKNSCMLLPIELFSFTAAAENNEVVVKWSTASELNNDFFTLERSSDAQEFTAIENIDGAGTTTFRQDYSVIDKHPHAGMNYYRLKQTDFDGHFAYSQIEAVQCAFLKDKIIMYPNPAGPVINVSGTTSNGVIVLYDLSGKELLRHTATDGITEIDLVKMVAGYYVLQYQSKDEVETQLFIKN